MRTVDLLPRRRGAREERGCHVDRGPQHERTWVGLDVHLASISGAALVSATGELVSVRLGGEPEGALAWVAGLPGAHKTVTYEAGPMGFGLARLLDEAGIEVMVCAPGKVPRAPRDKIKTDRRDAERLARLLMAGQLSAVRVSSVAEEGLRDLVRAREDLRRDLMACRHRITKMLLRYGLRHPMRYGRWSRDHRIWLGRVTLSEPAAQVAFLDQLGVYDFLLARRGQLEQELFARIAASPVAQTAARLRCLRGIDRLTAAGLVAEIGDFGRFESAPRLMSWLGLVPAEESSGSRRRLGHITKPARLTPVAS